MTYYDKDNCLVNFSNSILKNFNVKTFHSTIKPVDDFLSGSKKVVLILLDGCGSYILNKHLKEDSFLRSHVIHQMTSTFPSTTVAATDALLSGKFPIENGWMGWSQYVKSLDRNINVFKDEDSQTGEDVGKGYYYNLAKYPNLVDLINEKHHATIAKTMFEYPINKTTSKFDWFHLKDAYEFVHQKESGFVYAYFTRPDHFIHHEGVASKHAHRFIKKMNRYIRHFAKKYRDVVTLVIADHGLVDVKFFYVYEHEDFASLLLRPSTLEPRATSFFIKENKGPEFEKLFKQYYGKYFRLYTKEKALATNLFGEGIPNQLSLDTIGDYVAVAIDKYCFSEIIDKGFLADHAGTLDEEMLISIVGYKHA